MVSSYLPTHPHLVSADFIRLLPVAISAHPQIRTFAYYRAPSQPSALGGRGSSRSTVTCLQCKRPISMQKVTQNMTNRSIRSTFLPVITAPHLLSSAF